MKKPINKTSEKLRLLRNSSEFLAPRKVVSGYLETKGSKTFNNK